MKLIQLLFLFLLFFQLSCVLNNAPSEIRGNDFRLFRSTKVWDLALAVEKEDITKIKELALADTSQVNFQEPRYGKTLLMLAILNNKYSSCESLLEIGANPNIHDTYNGKSPMIYASENENKINSQSIEFLKLLLQFGGNPNDIEVGIRQVGNTTRNTPLISACGDTWKSKSTLEKVKLLVDAGADINYQNEFHETALQQSLLLKHFDVAYYLLTKGARFDDFIIDRKEYTLNGRKIFIQDYLREVILPLESDDYKDKMQIVKFLEEHGVEYRTLPIPEFVLRQIKENYPENWQKYSQLY